MDILSKKIKRDRFIYLIENISLMNEILHQTEDTVIIDDPILTREIEKLKIAVQEYEKNTGLKLTAR